MEQEFRTLFVFLLGVLGSGSAWAQGVAAAAGEDQCILCHANAEIWEGETLHLFVTPKDLAADIHWQKGIKCWDCHGGNRDTTDLRAAHAQEDGFRRLESPKDAVEFCGRCHTDAEYMQRFQPDAKTDQVARFWNSVHGRHLQNVGGPDAATCISCHPPHQMRPAGDPRSALHSSQLVETCGECHKDERKGMRRGVHHAAGEKDEFGRGLPLDCLECHGQDAHGMLPVRDAASPMSLDNQVAICGKCHEKYLASYEVSVHGHGLRASGLTVTAVCSDCHRAHDILYVADRQSSLHSANVAATCGKCHAFIQERLAHSVHGQGTGAGGVSERPSPGGKTLRHPSCVDCHQGHDLPHPNSPAFRRQIPNRCGNCHADYALRYGMSVHGQLTELGYEPASKCSDCHGDHDILASSNPASRISPERRLETCQRCHSYATLSFARFDPHANFKDERNYPRLYAIYAWTETVIYLLVGLFALHAFLWFVRSLIDALRLGRPKRLSAEQAGVVAFAPIHRIVYGVILLCFMALMFTGLPLKYSSQPWAQRLAVLLGGFESTSVWHHFFATLILAVAVAHVVWVAKLVWRARRQGTNWKQVILGPDSPVPTERDARDALGMLRWFVALGRKPRFERWTYWEKFDYWAVCLAMLLIGGSGLLLWFPTLATRILPGEVLNVAQVLHSETAMMVAGCLFLMHFFNTHLRPEKFPMDLSVVTGVVSEEHLRRARPEYLERLRREGKLQQMQVIAPSRRRLRLEIMGSLLVILMGLILLALSLLAYLGK
jgi:cytochrome b subunit of formate dehydrogenase/nitrate/TMAO reductase-like tetraheme cytochrome c subunit